jgi:excisionase family DNA binding protein
MTDLITTGEAARLLGVKAVTVRSYAQRGYLTGRKFGDAWAFTRAEVERLKANPPKRTGRPKRDTR